MSAVASTFLDTNILVYARDRGEPVKGPFADKLLQDIFLAGRPLLSVQVLSEFFWTVTRKLSVPLSHDEATAEVRRLVALASVVPVTQDLLDKALDLIASDGLTLWDAQIVAAARLTGAKVVLSEDLQHRQTIDGVTIVNPFAPDFVASEILAP